MRSNLDTIGKALTFSELSLSPVVITLPDYDEEYVAWLGLLVPWQVAVVWAVAAMGSFPSPEMKAALGNSIIRGIRSSVLGEVRTEAWANALHLHAQVNPAVVYGRLTSIFGVRVMERFPDSRITEEHARECLALLAPGRQSG